MNPKIFVPSLIAVLLACGMLLALWLGGKLEPANSHEATPIETTEQLAAGPAVGRAPKIEGEGPDALARGKHVYRQANCVGCHKWHGGGGGSYGGGRALAPRDHPRR